MSFRLTRLWVGALLATVSLEGGLAAAVKEDLPDRLVSFAMRMGYKGYVGYADGQETIFVEEAQRDYLKALRRYGSRDSTIRKVAQLFGDPGLYRDQRFVSAFEPFELVEIAEAFKLYFNEQRILLDEYFASLEFWRQGGTVSGFAENLPSSSEAGWKKPLLKRMKDACSRALSFLDPR